MLSALSTKWGKGGRVEAPGLDQEKGQTIHSFELASNKPTSWLIRILEHPWCQNKPWTTSNSLDSPRPEFGGSHHLPPYSILCVSPPHLHPNGTFSPNSQSGVSKLSQFGLPGLWAFITFRSDLRLGQSLKQTCNFPSELSNGVSHSTCTHQNRVDSHFQWSGVKLSTMRGQWSTFSQMAHARPFWTSKLEDLSNDIKNTSMQGVLTPAIAF